MKYFLNDTWCNDDTVTLLPAGAVLLNEAAWTARHGAPYVAPAKTQAEKDLKRYTQRAMAKNSIMAEFAAENMGRVRSGEWTVPQLVELTQDVQLIGLLNNISTLSFEIALSTVTGLTNPLITEEIKSVWTAKLQSHLYLDQP